MTNGNPITRRGAIATVTAASAGVMAAAASGNLVVPAQAQTQRKTFVLVHGAWHGGWCWRRVSDLLEKQGHKVFTPTLTGVGERAHLLSKDINLDTHITDVVNVFKFEDLKDVCLVAHSYGGWPCSGALEQIGDRVSSIIWLDAFKPANGETVMDYASEFNRKAFQAAIDRGEPGRAPPKAAVFHVNEKDRAWVDSKMTPQPNGVAVQPIKLTGAREKIAKKTYIRAPKFPQSGFQKAYAECKADKTWKTYETTEAGHDVMIDTPQWLVDVINKES
ncbi:MAG: alpha/beta fold hydrolase [Xanthobacteraceae bacterium]